MTLQEIAGKYGNLRVYEQRSAANDYIELVFYASEVDEWNKLFSDILGPAVKPPGVEPTEHDSELTKDYGGIFTGQTLFKKELDNTIIIAMFWPWQDDVHTTLKIALLRK